MRLSCLIPVYRLDASKLINNLLTQGKELQIDLEIVVLDDSAEYRDENWQYQFDHSTVKFINPDKNLGRAAARNRLLAEMSGEFGLFLDGDMRILDRFIARYLDSIEKYPDTILVGGIMYEEGESLRHSIGKKRESKPVDKRDSDPFQGFTAANLLIPRKIALNYVFSENIKTYGHEDTLFGLTLMEGNEKIVHIDNPAIHDGIDSNEEMMHKVETSIETLALLYRTEPIMYRNKDKVKVLRTALYFSNWLPILWFIRIKQGWRRALIANRCPLFFFDLYKLSYLIYVLRYQRLS